MRQGFFNPTAVGYGTMQDVELGVRTEPLTEQEILDLPLLDLLKRCQAQAPSPMESLNHLAVDLLIKRLSQEFCGQDAADLTGKKAHYLMSAWFQTDNLKLGLQGLIDAGIAKLHPERRVIGHVAPIMGVLVVAALFSGLSGKYWTLLPIFLVAMAAGSRLLYEHHCEWKAADNFGVIKAAKADLDANRLVAAVDKLYPLTQRFPRAELWFGVYPGVRVLAVKRIFQGLAAQACELQTYVVKLVQALAMEQEVNQTFANIVRLGS